MSKELHFLRLSGLVFVLTVVTCVGLRPDAVLTHDGLSFYGNFRQTFPVYGVGFGLTAYLLLRACRGLRDSLVSREFCGGLEAVALALLGIVATPSFSKLWPVQDLHVLFGLAIFVTQAGLTLQYLLAGRGERLDWNLFGLQLLAIGVVVLSFRTIGVLPLMLPAQLLAILAFGAWVLRVVAREQSRSLSTPLSPGAVSEVTSAPEL